MKHQFTPQLFIHESEPRPETLQPIKNIELYCKPYGGFWTSSFQGERGSDWVQWCIRTGYHHHYSLTNISRNRFPSYLIYPDENAMIYIVDSLQDLIALYAMYPQDLPENFLRLEPKQQELVRKMSMFIDYEKMAQEWDGIHLTKQGEQTTKRTYTIFDEMACPNLDGWDCESVLWFRWKFDHVKNLGIRHFRKG